MMVVVKCAPFWCWAAPASTGDRPRFSSKKEGQFWASLLPSHLLPQVVISTKFIEKMACPRNSLTCFFPWAKIAYNTLHLFSFNLSRLYNAENHDEIFFFHYFVNPIYFGFFTYLTKTHWEERWGPEPKFSRPNSSLAFLSLLLLITQSFSRAGLERCCFRTQDIGDVVLALVCGSRQF